MLTPKHTVVITLSMLDVMHDALQCALEGKIAAPCELLRREEQVTWWHNAKRARDWTKQEMLKKWQKQHPQQTK